MWQPIETAPKDGTQILALYLYKGHAPDYSIVEWNKDGWMGMCDGARAIEAQGDTFTDYHEPFVNLWMPLPEPPNH